MNIISSNHCDQVIYGNMTGIIFLSSQVWLFRLRSIRGENNRLQRRHVEEGRPVRAGWVSGRTSGETGSEVTVITLKKRSKRHVQFYNSTGINSIIRTGWSQSSWLFFISFIKECRKSDHTWICYNYQSDNRNFCIQSDWLYFWKTYNIYFF